MSEDRPFLLAWEDIVLRARFGSNTKLVALALKHHADPDGSNVRPGTARLCVLCDLGYVTVRRARQELLAAGLLELVRRGNRRRGHADEYRLVLAENLLDRLTWLSPSEVTAAAEKITEARQAAEAARVRKRDQGSETTPEDQGSQEPPDRDQGSHRTGKTGSGLTDDRDQGSLATPHQAKVTKPVEMTSPGLAGDLPTRARDSDESKSTTVDSGPTAAPACSACGALLDPGSTVCFVCRTRAAS